MEYLTRAVAESAYGHGAKFVDVSWFDPWVKRARIEHAAEDTLDFVPSWYGERMIALGDQHCATIGFAGPPQPEIMAGLDPARLGKDRLPALKESMPIVNKRLINWTGVPCPTPEWGKMLFPDLDESSALSELERLIFQVCRLNEPDPIAAWNERFKELSEKERALTGRRFDAIHFLGPGTDLTIGLLESSRWESGDETTVDGIRHAPNIPTEEIYTTPDPLRADGHVTATKPLVLSNGTVVKGLRVEFKDGQAVSIEADEGGEVLSALCHGDEGGTRLGEVSLVDGESQIGQLDHVFYTTLIDENAVCHLALGAAYALVDHPDDEPKINESGIHIDFMIGSNDVAASGITKSGERVPLLENGQWQI
jgi:aminopeptidase